MLKNINSFISKQCAYLWLTTLLVLGLAACANNPLSSYKSTMGPPLAALKMGDTRQAESAIAVNNNVLYYLEHGTLLRMDQQYVTSNQNFTQAQGYIDAWVASFHNGSLGNVTDTLEMSLVNDKVVDYVPKDYEKVMLPTYKSLNSVDLGNLDNARIEITRMYNIEDVIQNYRQWQYAKEATDDKNNANLTKDFASLESVEAANKNLYNFNSINNQQVLALKNSYQNAFSHYLAGFIFEAMGDTSLARPGYVKALQLSPNNPLIIQSISDLDKGNKVDNKTTDLLLVEEVGHAPQFKSVSIPVVFNNTTNGQNNCVNAVSISFPELVPDQDNSMARLNIDGASKNFTMLTNFNLMAARYLHDSLPGIFLRNIIRAAKDVTLQQSACNNGGSLASLLTAVGSMILSQADDRTWTLLPKEILVSRVKLPRGQHTISIITNNVTKNISVNLTKGYQIFAFRVIAGQVYVSEENTMVNK